jgi:hypothetical protein
MSAQRPSGTEKIVEVATYLQPLSGRHVTGGELDAGDLREVGR